MGLCRGSERMEEIHDFIAQSGIVLGQPVRYGLESEPGVAREMRLDVAVAEEVTVGDEKGDVEATVAEQFG
ncbi:hypothetical protein Acr_02g0003910 [Actinidia rufa]|uniref:Uncharacterized protein n=1 Tax=Actinidia rufa TaxID=165716 RepID=A0A7J0E6M6_9ERIC|nr:hypothetical protein Acr_02g0003910 [Actinidia rufa]